MTTTTPTGEPTPSSPPTGSAPAAPGAPTSGPATPAAPATAPAAPPAPPAPVAPGAPGPEGQPVYVPPGYMLVPAQGQGQVPSPAASGPQYVPVAPLPQPADSQEGDPDDRDISRLPGWAQNLIAGLRRENAERRISERTAVVTQHGLAAAQQLGVNPAALLSSIPWAEAAKQLDPRAPDFPQQLTATIERIVQSAPWMRAETAQPQPAQAPPPPPSGGDFSAGSGAGAPITREQLASMSPDEIAKAYAEGRLKHLMT